MTFEEILDQAITLLQRRGRLTYGALKRQFQLDEAYLDDLKAELIEGQRVAMNENGRVLVWIGGVDIPPSPPPHCASPVSSSPTPETSLGQPAPHPMTPSPPAAERR